MNVLKVFFVTIIMISCSQKIYSWHTVNRKGAMASWQHLNEGKRLYAAVGAYQGKIFGGQLQYYSQASQEDLTQARFHFEEATRLQKDPFLDEYDLASDAEALLFLGLIYYLGEGVERDMDGAISYFDRASKVSRQATFELPINWHVEAMAAAYLAEISWIREDYSKSAHYLAQVLHICEELKIDEERTGRKNVYINYDYIEHARNKGRACIAYIERIGGGIFEEEYNHIIRPC